MFGMMQEDSYKEKTSTPRRRAQPFTTIKAPIPSEIKVRIIYHSLALYSCENSSNLTFRGYSAGTTLVLSGRSYLFIMQVLFRVCKYRTAHWWYSQLHHFLNPIYAIHHPKTNCAQSRHLRLILWTKWNFSKNFFHFFWGLGVWPPNLGSA